MRADARPRDQQRHGGRGGGADGAGVGEGAGGVGADREPGGGGRGAAGAALRRATDPQRPRQSRRPQPIRRPLRVWRHARRIGAPLLHHGAAPPPLRVPRLLHPRGPLAVPGHPHQAGPRPGQEGGRAGGREAGASGGDRMRARGCAASEMLDTRVHVTLLVSALRCARHATGREEEAAAGPAPSSLASKPSPAPPPRDPPHQPRRHLAQSLPASAKAVSDTNSSRRTPHAPTTEQGLVQCSSVPEPLLPSYPPTLLPSSPPRPPRLAASAPGVLRVERCGAVR
eukprot:673598-Rhodomonas_salina.3